MSTKMVKYWKDKEVLVTVYVERPRRKRPTNTIDTSHDQSNHYTGKGYNRRAELLLYSQRLRESAKSTMMVVEPSPMVESKPKPTSSIIPQAKDNIVAVETKPALSRTTSKPARLGNWNTVMPAFLRRLTSLQSKQRKKYSQAGSTSNGMKSVYTEIPKKKGFIAKLLSVLSDRKYSM